MQGKCKSPSEIYIRDLRPAARPTLKIERALILSGNAFFTKFNFIPLQIPAGFSIAPNSCRVAGERGTCMFVWECLKTDGQHLGMCMDGFMFGSCCVHDEKSNKVKVRKTSCF